MLLLAFCAADGAFAFEPLNDERLASEDIAEAVAATTLGEIVDTAAATTAPASGRETAAGGQELPPSPRAATAPWSLQNREPPLPAHDEPLLLPSGRMNGRIVKFSATVSSRP